MQCSLLSRGMIARGMIVAAAVLMVGARVGPQTAEAQAIDRSLPMRSAVQSTPPLLDDATLNDVQFIGAQRGWAVGDRGVIWRTEDAGTKWKRLASGVDCSLSSVCFLTNRVGWVCGGGVTPHVRTTYGVILGTTNGGDTWTVLSKGTLPLLHHVQFFGLDEGRAICEPTSQFPSGVIATNDGGKSWHSVKGESGQGWRTGAFQSSDAGFVAGRLGRFTSVAKQQVLPALTGAPGLRGIADVSLQTNGDGWFAGDGGLVMQTENGGASWRMPAGELPRTVRDTMDFRAVESQGDRVWLAGMPGSVVWHSDDGGRTWKSQSTGVQTPIEALHFANETNGWAVGALGSILATHDGGTTWSSVRGGRRRVALLALHAHESRVSLGLVKKYGHEQGYRTAVTLMSRRDVGPDGDAGRTLDLRLNDAVTSAGGVASSVDWAFPVAAPELDHYPQQLIREWQLLTDNRLREVMLSRLVVQLRSWRPDVLIIDDAPVDDATTKLLADAIKLAIKAAAEEGEGELATLLHLPPWQVKRAFRRLPVGSEGRVSWDAHEFLPRQGAAIVMAAADAYGRLSPNNVNVGQRESYEPLPLDEAARPFVGRDLFAGLVLAPGGDARRVLSTIDDRDLERRQNLAQHQRNFASYAEQMLDDPRRAAQIIGQMKDVIGAAPPEQAAIQLAELAKQYQRRGDWEHTQTTLFELVERYPEQPAALDAMRWLFQFTSSAEVSWQRLRESSTGSRSETRVDGVVVQASVREAIERARERESQLLRDSTATSGIQQASATTSLQLGGTRQHAKKVTQWQQQAARLAELLEQKNPAFFAEPTIQFPLAALERARKHPRQADVIVQSFLSAATDNAWGHIAAGEAWIALPSTVAPGAVALCHRTSAAPYLDGQLDDACWQRALPIPLKTEREHQQASSSGDSSSGNKDDSRRATVRFAYDAGFLYLAAQLPRDQQLPSDPPSLPGRIDDADLSGYDRLSLQFDVDRDYATYYRFDIDQRGHTADACWHNENWNGKRFVAIDSDTSMWRLEMAIPFTELVPQPPTSGDTWSAAATRILPTIGVESWTTPAGSTPTPEGFGLLRFE